MMMHGYGVVGSLVLIALGIGYLVCADAKKQSGTLKTVGYVIGTAIIILSILAGLYKISCYKVSRWGGACPFIQGKMMEKSPMQK